MARLHLTLPVLCTLFFSGCSHSRFNPAVEGQKLLQRDAEWSQAASEGKDIERIVSDWSDDAQVIEPGQPVYQGKAAIRKFVSESLKTQGFHIRWVSRDPVFSPDGKMAYMPGVEEMRMPNSNGALIKVHTRGISIWRCRWRVAVRCRHRQRGAARLTPMGGWPRSW
jgi:ketosteroid isomerase-like protein